MNKIHQSETLFNKVTYNDQNQYIMYSVLTDTRSVMPWQMDRTQIYYSHDNTTLRYAISPKPLGKHQYHHNKISSNTREHEPVFAQKIKLFLDDSRLHWIWLFYKMVSSLQKGLHHFRICTTACTCSPYNLINELLF